MATNEIRILINAINRSSGAFKQAHGDVESLGVQIAKAGAIIGAFGLITKKAFDFAEEGAQIERLRETGTKLAQSFGLDMDEAVSKIKAVSLNSITATKAVLQVNRTLLLGISSDANEIAKLVEIAALRGRAMGLSTQEAFDRITLGIGRLSTRILDDIGIVVDGETAYENFAKAIGKTADQLTEAQKREALKNAIITEGNELLARAGGLILDNAQAFEEFETRTTDATNALKEFLAQVAVLPVRGANAVLSLGDIGDATEQLMDRLIASSSSEEEFNQKLQEVWDSMPAGERLLAQLIGAVHSLGEETAGTTFIERQWQLEYRAKYEALQKTTKALQEQRAATAALAKAQEDAIKTLEGLRIKIEDLDFEKAGKIALDFFKDTKMTDEDLATFERLLTTHLGTMSKSLETFIFALEDAAESGKGAWDAFLSAFDAVKLEQAAQKTIELWDEVDAKIRDLRDEFAKDVLDSERQLADDMEDAATKRDRDLADLEEENNRQRDEAIADANKKRQRDEEDAESAHQRRIQKILDKYNRARLQALLDLDARALFEAELTRDQELKDAELDRRERKEQAEKELKDKIEDIEDNYEEKRRETLRQYDRDIEDAKEADRRRQRDAERARDEAIATQEAYRREEEANIESFLSDRQSKELLDYNQRISDLIKYWQGVMFINDYYRNLDSGGEPPQGPPPSDPIDSDPGYPTDGGSGEIPPGSDFPFDPIGPPTPSGSNIVVTLNVQGDGVLAQMVRQSALNAIVDVVSN